MPISVGFIFLALALYTFSIFRERIMGHLKTWIVVIFAIGFTSDVIGTSLMFLSAKVKFSMSIHTFCGYAALFIMGAHLIWAILALWNVRNCEKNFTRFSIYAWLGWMFAFISGIPKVSSVIISWLSQR